MPLRRRLGVVFAFATAVLIGVVGVGFVLQLRSGLDATIDAGLRSRAATLADQYAAGGVGALRLDRDDEPVQVLTLDRQVIASSPELAPVAVIDQAQRDDALVRANRGADPLAFTAGDGNDRTRYLVTRLSDQPGPDPAQVLLVVGTGTEVADAADDHVEMGLLVIGPLAALVAGFGAWWLAGAALRPVERMRRQAAELGERDVGAHLAVPDTRDEIAALARTMNDLLDRLRAALEHERGFVADAGHELRTPLATLRAELELAARPGRSRADLQASVTAAGEETERLVRLAEDLLLLARAQGEQTFLREDTVDLAHVVALAARGATVRADPRGVDVVVDGPERLAVPGDPDRLRQAVDNVLDNAVHHSPDDGVVLVSTTVADGHAVIRVADDGPGFPPEFLPHAFERFTRADTARARSDGGTGLGLAIVEAVVRAHHGRVQAHNRAEGGAVVRIDLPREDGAAR